MPKYNNLDLKTSVDDLFKTDKVRKEEAREKVSDIALSDLIPFSNHPFKVIDNLDMAETVRSIKKYGVLVPAIARPLENGKYELISGHRRHHASQLLGIETMPVLVRDLDDEEATIIMVDSNLQREFLLPSERAFAYKLRLEAMKKQAGRPSKNNYSQVGNNIIQQTSSSALADQMEVSKNQIYRFIRLTNLIPELLEMVDNKKMALNPAVEISYLKTDEQIFLLDTIAQTQKTPSLSQAQHLKKLSVNNKLSKEVFSYIFIEEKKPESEKITLKTSEIKNFFPKNYSSENMEKFILKLLADWHQKQVKKQKLRQQQER